MPIPINDAVHHDRPLSNLSLMAFESSPGFIGQRLFPIINVGKESDRYYIIEKESWLRAPNALRARKSSAATVKYTVSSESYYCDNYALRTDNALEDLSNADTALQLRRDSALFLTDMLLRDLEVRTANIVTSISNVGSGVTLSGTSQWSDYVNSDPLADVTTGHAFIRQNTGLKANVAAMSEDTFEILRRHPQLLEMYKYTSGGQLDQQQLASALNVSELLISSAVYNSNLRNVSNTASMSTIFGNNLFLAHVRAGQTLKTQTFGLTFRWRPEGIASPMQAVRYMDGDPSKKVEWTEVGHYIDNKVVAKDLGYLIASTH